MYCILGSSYMYFAGLLWIWQLENIILLYPQPLFDSSQFGNPGIVVYERFTPWISMDAWGKTGSWNARPGAIWRVDSLSMLQSARVWLPYRYLPAKVRRCYFGLSEGIQAPKLEADGLPIQSLHQDLHHLIHGRTARRVDSFPMLYCSSPRCCSHPPTACLHTVDGVSAMDVEGDGPVHERLRHIDLHHLFKVECRFMLDVYLRNLVKGRELLHCIKK